MQNTQNNMNNSQSGHDMTDYTIKISNLYAGLGIIAVLFILVVSILELPDANRTMMLIWIPFGLAFISAGAYLAIYSLRWKIDVRGEHLTVYRLFGKPRSLTIGDITRIKYGVRTTAYIDGKKVFSMDNRYAIGSVALYLRLRELGKIDGLRNKDDFVISVRKWVVVAVFCFFLVVAVCLAAPFSINSSAVLTALAVDGAVQFLYIMFTAISLFTLFYAIHLLRFRIIIDNDILKVRKVLHEKTYSFKDISRVNIDIRKNISIYINEKRILRVAFINPDYPLWIKKFESEGIQISPR